MIIICKEDDIVSICRIAYDTFESVFIMILNEFG
jgi:hypothetical protein